MSGEIVMYIIVNKEIKMSSGKLAAQAAHSAVKAIQLVLTHDEHSDMRTYYNEWNRASYTKIVLKASQYEIEQFIKEHPSICCWTVDEGRTEIPKGSLTTLALIPLPREIAQEYVKNLKLL